MTPRETNDFSGFLYPGQGAQRIGMGTDLESHFGLARQRFAEAEREVGFSIRELCARGPEASLNEDVNAQLALYTVSCIITDILKKERIFPKFCTGYSSGFYAAAYAAECFDFASGLSIVRQAGEMLMEEGRQIDGGMAVLFGLSVEQVDRILQKEPEVGIAILNTPRQIVISGINAALRKVMTSALDQGALDAYPLPVATAYHSRYMQNAGRRLRQGLQKKRFRAPRFPLYSYTTLQRIADEKDLCDIMALQLSRPVFWVDLIKKLRHNESGGMVEIGSGKLISRTVRWIDRTIAIMSTDSLGDVRQVIQALALN